MITCYDDFGNPYFCAGSYMDTVKIRGRGVISGKVSDHKASPIKLCGRNIIVTGITIVNSYEGENLGVNEVSMHI